MVDRCSDSVSRVLFKVNICAFSLLDMLTAEVEPNSPVLILDLVISLLVLKRVKVKKIAFFREHFTAFMLVVNML
jgi:hypothetical protein